MNTTTEALVFAVLGLVVGAGVTLAWGVSHWKMNSMPERTEAEVPPGVATVLAVLRSSALVVDENDVVLRASAPAFALGLVRDGELRVPEVGDAVRQVRRDGEIQDIEFVVPAGVGRRRADCQARIAPLSSRVMLVLVDDRTRERRVEEIRRDFVANVSHELKTPVGAIDLLAEALAQASDEPEAVERFAGRIQHESARLSRLVRQIIELSRLQDDKLHDDATDAEIDLVVQHAFAQVATDAEAKEISLVSAGQRGLVVKGEDSQVTLALGNLIANAIAYSPHGANVTVSLTASETMVDIAVHDDGIGISTDEIDRIFERFYRVDPARHRSTGGTGLGLSIVKHVVASHGGEMQVESTEGQGSTFTMSLPRNIAEAENREVEQEVTT